MGFLTKIKIAKLKRRLASVTALLQTAKVQKDVKLAKKLTALQAVLTDKISALEQSKKKVG
ncbi:hypothetical protein KY361_01625 [Candidatus Woesearchaeota archaeon]|nr:hypothetical protein [Candidatus Woesearchaeota archaeon]